MTQELDAGWHVQVCEREWVFWGYGPRMPHLEGEPPEVGSFIDPAVIYLYLDHGPEFDLEIPWEPPKTKDRTGVEYGRRTCWGWRVRNDRCHSCEWHVADSRERCLEDAREWLEQRAKPGERGQALRDAINDVREGKGGII